MNTEKVIQNYWMQVDSALSARNMTLTDMCDALGVKRKSIYSQRARKQLPKLDLQLSIAKLLELNIVEIMPQNDSKSPMEEYLPYLEKADPITLSNIRKLLDMPAEENGDTFRLPSHIKVG